MMNSPYPLEACFVKTAVEPVPPSGDADAAVGFLKRLPHPFPTLTFIPIDPVTHEKLARQIETKSFAPPIQWAEVARWVDERNGRGNLYWSVNPLKQLKHKKS